MLLSTALVGGVGGLSTQTIAAGPAGTEKESVDAIDGSNPIILKAIANT